ncbi:DUF397 domain-containing protein [Streptomyces sp. GSL17-111]|uniref:DUF397 domain-containing protein n=1 Tax=Streptomyces sp. GSL17-111 TaxID=3121596 RepID=UPI0030F3C514
MTLKLSPANGSTLAWTKSSHSSNDGPDCVEVAATPATVHVRDSKNPAGPALALAPATWSAFITWGAESR